MTAKQKMTQARDLIRARQYGEARAILETVDHPLAREWLSKLDRIAPLQQTSSWTKSRQTTTAREQSPGRPAQRQPTTAPAYGLLLLLVVAVLGGVGVGLLLFYSSTIVYILIFSPLLAAGLAGLIIDQGIRLGKMRDGFTAVVFAVFMGLAVYGTYRYAEYVDFRREIREEILQINSGVNPSQLDVFIDDRLRQETGYRAFPGYIMMTAREGIALTISSRYSRDEIEGTIGEGPTVIYWGIEMLIMLIVPAWMAHSGSRQPFCEDENTWLKFKKIGHVPGILAENFVECLQAGDFYTAGSYIEKKGVKVPRLDIEVGRCGDNAPTAALKVMVNKERDLDVLLITNISAAQYKSLIS
jgi:hypothetical protein